MHYVGGKSKEVIEEKILISNIFNGLNLLAIDRFSPLLWIYIPLYVERLT